MFEYSMESLFNKEFMVLQSITNFVFLYTQKHGPTSFQCAQEKLYNSLNEYWEKYDNLVKEEDQNNKLIDPTKPINPLLMKEFLKTRSDVHLTQEALYRALQAFIQALPENSELLTNNILELIYNTNRHIKKEMRVIGYRYIYFQHFFIL